MSKKQLRQIRREKDLTQEELAKLTGISSRSITSYENDVSALRNASYEVLERLAKALGVEVEDIDMDRV